MSGIVGWLRERASTYELLHAQPDLSIGMRNAAVEIESLRKALTDIYYTTREDKTAAKAKAALEPTHAR